MAILLTKVRPPQRRKDVLRRVRLIDILHQNLHRKLTFVSAPAGYGKTTLLVDFAADVDAIVCWYRISPEDNDLVQFVAHLIAAFQQQVANFGKELEEKLNSMGGAPDAATLAVDFINEVEQKVDDFSLLVLDDYHLAGENQQIVDFVENFLEHLPDRLRILIGSRSVYGIPTANLYVRDELVTISAEELRFRAEELQKLVLQNYRIRLSDEQADEFAKRADGWIIAILLALRTMENGTLPKLSGGIQQVYEYLAEEVVSRQSEHLRDFMLATSILGDFNEALCNYLLERKDSASSLQALEDRNLFVSRTEMTEGPSYRYHQLFSEFLQDYFGRTQKPRLAALHHRAAEWHRGRKEWEAAIDHKLAAGDKEKAAAWIDKVAKEYYVAGRQALLARWVTALGTDPNMQKEAPRLLLYHAKFLVNQSRFAESLRPLDIANPAFKHEGDFDLLANVAITRGMVARFTGEYKQAINLAQQAQDLLNKKSKRRRHSLQWYQAERLKGLPTYFLGDIRGAIKYLKAAVAGFRRLGSVGRGNHKFGNLYDLAETLNDLGLVYINNGQLLDAQQAFQETLDIHINLRSNLGALASARNNIAYLHHQIGQYAEAWHEYSLALEHARAANLIRVQVAILNGRGDLLLDVGEKEEAERSFQQAHSLPGEPTELVGTFAGLARVERLRGHFSESMNWLRRGASFRGGAMDETDYALEMGNVYAGMGQLDLALREFEKAMAGWPKQKAPKQSQVMAAFLAAKTHLQKQQAQKAEKLLNKALEGAARLGYDQFLVAAARWSNNFLSQFVQTNSSEQIKALAERAANFIPGKAALERKSSEPTVRSIHIEVQAFGPGEIRLDGELLSMSVWRSSRARALFFYLLDRGRARKDTIGLDFWPDFSSGKISSNFHATLWRVRQALGFKEAIVYEQDHYSLHPSFGIWYDVWEFESYLKKAGEEQLSKRARGELLKQALDLYKQSYLQDIFMEWTDRRREELRALYVDALLDLASMEAESKHYREAKLLYEKILGVDPYRDEVHLSLMKCLALSGAPSAAIAHFKQYRALLRKELNAEPLRELREYYNQLSIKAQTP
ncbi:MAG: BTAD domain-containing putative transcriptional regulator [Anaerolineales bacterium]